MDKVHPGSDYMARCPNGVELKREKDFPMDNVKSNPRILIVTPEITYLPDGMGNMANKLKAKAGGLADVSAALVNALFQEGADVHVALPNYRAMFKSEYYPSLLPQEIRSIRDKIPEERIHLAADRAFFYLLHVYSSYDNENSKIALAFQREVINNIIPKVKPDLIHCNDWMTGLIPAYARWLNIPCLFTIHNIHTVEMALGEIEDRGIDAAPFWQHLYFVRQPGNYEETRDYNPVDLLTSGVFGAHFVNTVSPTFLEEIVAQRHSFIEPHLNYELSNKINSGCAAGILNAPDPSFNPATDRDLKFRYTVEKAYDAKRKNKVALQNKLGLIEDPDAPMFFWPSRLDSMQKGCQLLAEILYQVISKYWKQNLQIVFVANGGYQWHFRNIVAFHKLFDRVRICDFEGDLERMGYAASDFTLMPSLFEPCGLPQMIAPIYGSLPVAHDTGGIHDTISDLDVRRKKGNGFLFKHYDAQGLFWAIDQAMKFYQRSKDVKERQIKRIMTQSAETFNHRATARKYIDLYEEMLKRPLVN